MKKILIIEDNHDIRTNTAEILELSNYEVLTAENGKEGVQLALEHRPDLIICDIMMPELDGYGVLHAVQRNDAIKNIPFIFLTAKTERSDFRKGMEMGADDYISKPFDGTELLRAVDSRLKKHDFLKQEFSPGIDGIKDLVNTSGGPRSLQDLAADRNMNTYKKKQVIYSEGNHPNRIYYVAKGKVKTYRSNDDGKELVMEIYTAGDFFGYIPLLEGTLYKDTAETLEDCELAVIPGEDFESLVNNSPDVLKSFVRLLANNISDKESKLLALAYNSLRKKVAEALVLLHDKNKEANAPIHLSRENLAGIAGTATESLIRTLGDFKSEKLIEIENGAITILQMQKLRNLLN